MKDFDLVTIIKWVLIVIFAIGIGGPFGLLAIALYVGYQAAKKDKRMDEIISEPTPDTIDELMDILKKRIYHNHPDSWKKIRAKWHLINISEKIPTDSKEEILRILLSKGLMLSDRTIYDNYKGTSASSDSNSNQTQTANIANDFNNQTNVINDMNNLNNINNINAVNEMNNINMMNQQINNQFDNHAMEESRKAVTPFDHGGYVQGDGFNPSDTMAADAQRQMTNDMNNMNNLNDMGNMGGMGMF